MDVFALPPETKRDVVNAKPRGIEQFRVGDDGLTVSVIFHHGSWEGFDRVEWRENDDSVTITVFVGTYREIAERQAAGQELRFTLQAIYRRAVVTLDSELGSRRIIDGSTRAQLED
jgi:hypothetical protein